MDVVNLLSSLSLLTVLLLFHTDTIGQLQKKKTMTDVCDIFGIIFLQLLSSQMFAHEAKMVISKRMVSLFLSVRDKGGTRWWENNLITNSL